MPPELVTGAHIHDQSLDDLFQHLCMNVPSESLALRSKGCWCGCWVAKDLLWLSDCLASCSSGSNCPLSSGVASEGQGAVPGTSLGGDTTSNQNRDGLQQNAMKKIVKYLHSIKSYGQKTENKNATCNKKYISWIQNEPMGLIVWRVNEMLLWLNMEPIKC